MHARRLLHCILLFALALLLRALYLHFVEIGSPESDAKEYAALARHVAEGRGFTYDGLNPSTYRPPLFSWLLGAWCFVMQSSSLRTMVAFQALVQSLCSPLTYLLLCRVRQDRAIPLAGGLFVAAYPFLISTVDQILQEPTQMLTASGIGLATLAWFRRPTLPWAAACGALFGVAALAKSPFLAMPVAVLLVWLAARDVRRRLPFRHVVVTCASCAMVVIPWSIRNYRVTGGHLVPINSQNLSYPVWMVADGNFHPRESLSEPVPEAPPLDTGVALTYGNPDGVAHLNRANEQLLLKGLTGMTLLEGLAAAARMYLVRHPLYLLKITVRGVILLFSPDASAGLSQYLFTRLVAMVVFHLPLAAGLLIGAVRAAREKNAAFMILALFTALYLVAHAPASIGGGRYSVPVMPILMAVGCYGLWGDRSALDFSKTTSRRGPNNKGLLIAS